MPDSDGNNDKLVVPKFSSFKTSQSAPDIKGRSHKDIARSERNNNSSKSQKSQNEKRHPSRHHESRRVEHDSTRQLPNLPPEVNQASASPFFVIDSKGDRLISKYGGIDRAQIPAYYRYGGGRVLGTSGRLVIHRDGARDNFSLRYPGEGLGILDKNGLRSRSFRPRQDPIRLRAAVKDYDGDVEEFLSLRNPSKKRKHNQVDTDSENDEQPSYRSIEGKAKPKTSFDDESDDSEGEDEKVPLDQDNPLKWKSIQLNRHLKEHPGDIDAWLELVNHQDDLQRAGKTIDHRTAADTAHSFSEIKVSMLESALENTSAAEDRATVLVRLMREGMKVWTTKAANKKWEDVVGEEENNFPLWQAHIDFYMTNIAIFQYDVVKQMLLARLQKASSKEDWSQAIYIFLRATRLMHDAGYKELAVSAWQAILELNYFKPNQEPSLDSFRDFWESEVPRLGEVDAQGWRHFAAASGQAEAPEPRTDAPLTTISTRDVYKAWAHSERDRAVNANVPARTMDEGTEDDPFRVVMFSDVEPWLFTIPDGNLEAEIEGQLVDAFLIFCGLPPAIQSSTWTELAFTDQFILKTAVLSADNHLPSQSPVNSAELPCKSPMFDGNNSHQKPSPRLLCSAGTSWFRYFSSDTKDLSADPSWILNVMKQLVHSADLEALALYYLGFCYIRDPPSIKKPAKALLKKYPSAAEIYNAYAVAEFSNGNMDVGMKVLASATESSLLSVGALGFQLFMTWCWAELERGNKSAAVVRLCSSVDGPLDESTVDADESTVDADSPSPSVLLKTKQILSSNFHQCLYEGKAGDAGRFAEGMVLLSYLTDGKGTEPTSISQGNISGAIATIENVSTEYKSRGYADTHAHERVLQFGAELLYFNACHGPFRRLYMRDQLSRFLGWFPRNTVFLNLIEWADSSLRVIDETRQLLYDKVLVKEHDCVSSRLFSIRHELSCGNLNTVQAAFEHTLSSDSCKSNVGIWRSYIKFCYLNKELRPKAKDIFYRALRHCSWSKEILMEAFDTLIRDFKSDELRSVYNTITSKGLRVHLDLEEYTEEWRRDKGR